MADSQDILNQLAQMTTTYASQLQRLAAGMSGTTATITGAANQLKPTLAQVGAGMMKLRGEIDRGRVGYADAGRALRALEQEFEDLDDTLKRSKQGESIRNEQMRMSSQLVGQAFGELAADIGKISLSAFLDYYKNQTIASIKAMQENVGGMQAAYNEQNITIQSFVDGLKNVSTALGVAAAGMNFIPGLQGVSKAAGTVAAGLGAASLGLGTYGDAVKLLQSETLKTSNAFKNATAAGALFADGMTDLRRRSADARLDTEFFGKLMQTNSETFSRLGGIVGKGVDRFIGINKEMFKFREGLLNLGYSIEDQAQATVDYMSLMQKTGQLENMTATQVAENTDKYLTNLRALSSLTGEDVKSLQKRISAEVDQAAVRARLEQAGPGATEKMGMALGMLPKEMGNAVRQAFVLGPGSTGLDPETQLALQQVPIMREFFLRSQAGIRDSGKTPAQFKAEQERFLIENRETILAQAKAAGMAGTAMINALTGSFKDSTSMINQFYDVGQRGIAGFKTGAETSNEAAERLKNTLDPLTTEINKAETAFRDTAAALTDRFTPAVKNFVDGLDARIKESASKSLTGFGGWVIDFAAGLGQEKRREADKPTEDRRGNPNLETGPTGRPIPSNAKGGIVSGPLSGFLSMLHGTEAVVPLPDNKKIPVNINYSNDLISNTLTDAFAGGATNLVGKTFESQTQQLNDTFATAMASLNTQLTEKNRDLLTSVTTDPEKLSTSVANAVISAFNSPSELTRVMEMVKEQIANGSKEQLEALQTQLDKMDQLVTAMQNNVYASERIANELA